MDQTILEKHATLMRSLEPHKGTPQFMRAMMWVKEKTGKNLAEYLSNGATAADKHTLLDDLIGIVQKGYWDKLPKAPANQAQAGGGISPSAAITKKPASPPRAKVRAVDPEKLHPLQRSRDAVLPEVPREEAPAPAPALPPSVADQLAAVIAQLVPKPTAAAPAEPPVTREQVRSWVRLELASVFATVAEVMRSKETENEEEEIE